LAVVTGASRGIGRAIALRLARDFSILALARDGAALETLAAEIAVAGGECRTSPVDLTDGAAVERSLEGVEAHAVVNNAGVGVIKPFLEITPEEWHRMVDVNLNALYHVTRALLPGMVRRGEGHVVLIGSIAGRSAFAGGSGYTATKWGVMGLSESLLLDVREHGVKVSIVNPGSVATGFSASGPAPWKISPAAVADAVAYTLSTPPDVLVHRMEIRTLSPQRKG
jgi:3-oxoacyl-[acyl-carrier protein] reductase